jgi:hypothetical protein
MKSLYKREMFSFNLLMDPPPTYKSPKYLNNSQKIRYFGTSWYSRLYSSYSQTNLLVTFTENSRSSAWKNTILYIQLYGSIKEAFIVVFTSVGVNAKFPVLTLNLF